MAAFVESQAVGALFSEAALHTPGAGARVGIASQHASRQQTLPQMQSTAIGTTRPAWQSALGLSTVALCLANRQHHRNGRRKAARVPMHGAVLELADNLTKLEDGKYERSDLRNVAIIAHVDHGKTTLTDALMTQCGDIQKETTMDSNQLEMERGITILAKNAAIRYRDVKINIIDTPGHADFGAEVERILNMADACILLVDAQEGPMPQTKFVLRKAIELEKKTMVVINKVDKPSARPDWVLDQTFDLFASLGASDELCDFPVCYASGINGIASVDSPDELAPNLMPLLDQILEECPKPPVEPERPLQMLVANLDYDDYVGRICIGRVTSGSLKVGDKIGFMYGEEGEIRGASITKLWEFQNNERIPVDEVTAGDICAFSGTDDVVIGDTVVDPAQPLPMPPIEVEEPTVVMEFGVNRSPLAGKLKEAVHLTGSKIEKRLQKECLTNLAVRMEPGETAESFKVKGRGTLQLGILMENMRREGFEFMVGAPQVLYRKDPETGKKQEPYEEAVVEVPSELQGAVMDEFNKKSGVLKSMDSGSVANTMVLTFTIPTSCLIGMQGKMVAKTKGQAVLNSRVSHWDEVLQSDVKVREKGSIVTMAAGKATTYSLMNIQARGSTFINAGDEVYEGMCIGVSNKEFDMECNITKEKAVNNTRAGGYGGPSVSRAAGASGMSIEDFLGHMEIDELLEITPGPLRLCKKNAKGLKSR